MSSTVDNPSPTRTLTRITWSVTADGLGNVSEAAAGPHSGRVIGAIVTPGSPAPTDNFSLSITANGLDLLQGGGYASSHNTPTWIAPVQPAVIGLRTPTLVVAGAGAAAALTVELFIESV